MGGRWGPGDPRRVAFAGLREPALRLLREDPTRSDQMISRLCGGVPSPMTVWRLRQELVAQEVICRYYGRGSGPGHRNRTLPHDDRDCWCAGVCARCGAGMLAIRGKPTCGLCLLRQAV